MENKKYSLRFIPLFEQDLADAVDYISYRLKNPDAAARLVDEVQGAIQKRLNYPEAFEPYPSLKERQHPYYRIYVKNYIVFYVVIDDVMEVRRLIYNRRNIKEQL